MPWARFFSSSTMSSLAMDGRRLVGRGLIRGHPFDHPGQGDGEGRALVRARADRGDGAAVALDHRLHDEEPEAGTRVAAPDLAPDAVEAVEDEAQVGSAHAHPVIPDA